MAEGLAGRRLLHGEYELGQILGRGGMATVYRAHSHSLDTDVAVKVLASRLAADPGFRERFHDEARSLAGLHHPNLVEVHHYGEEDDLVYIVMRLVPGGTLKDRLRGVGGPLDLVSTARLISQVSEALQHAHEGGLVHLDIKPANVLLGRADWPLLADFGITRAVAKQDTGHGGQRIAGTPIYMSPEQCRGGPVDGRSDQYSLAITAYEMLTGRWPFEAETTEALLQQHIHDLPPNPRTLNPGIPGPVEKVLLRGLAKAPEDRFPTIREFAGAFSAAVEEARGVTLETKAALAGVTPNLLAMLGLVLLAPLLLALLPAGTLLGGRMPLVWPFQLLFSLLLAGLLLGMRWHAIGLLARGLGGMLGRQGPLGGHTASARPARWQNAVIASVEGVVNLAYLFAIYRLVAEPALAILGLFVDPAMQAAVAAVLTGIVGLVALGIIVGLYRVGGPVVVILVLAACWSIVDVLPTFDVALAGGLSLAWTVKAVVGAGALVLLLATRARLRGLVGALAVMLLGQALAEARPGVLPDELHSTRRRLAQLAGGIVDFVYLIAGYALLRTPLLETLQPALGPLAAATAVSAVAMLLWLFLTVRLRRVAGLAGVALGLLLGAPLLISLPLLREQLLGVAWPTAVASWVVGTVLVLLLAAVRGEVQATGRRALRAQLDRSILGSGATPSEDHAARWTEALGGLAGGAIDLAYLVIGYWALGLPAANALAKVSGRAEAGSLLLVALLLAGVAVLAGPARGVAAALRGMGGPRRTGQARALPVLAALVAALVVGGAAAAPATLLDPAAGGLALIPSRGPMMVVDWSYWLPWTPGEQYATYHVSLSCSDGRSFGHYREAVPVAPGAHVPSGSIGQLGPTSLLCDDWREGYLTHRRLAGLPSEPTFSWDWLAVQVVIQADGTAEVIERHRVLFTNGVHRQLVWKEGVAAESGALSDVELWEGDVRYAMNGGESPYSARVWEEDGQQVVGWWFPPVTGPAERTYTLKYRLDGALRPTASWRFERTIVAKSPGAPVWRTTIAVQLPAEFEAPEVRPAARGSAAARHGMLDRKTVWFEAQDVAPGEDLVVRVDFPDGQGDVPPTPPATPLATMTAMPTATLPPPSATPSLTAQAALSPTATAPVTDTPTATAVPPATGTPAVVAPTVAPTGTPPPATPTSTPMPPTPTNTPLPPTPTNTPLPACTIERFVVSPQTATAPFRGAVALSWSAKDVASIVIRWTDELGPHQFNAAAAAGTTQQTVVLSKPGSVAFSLYGFRDTSGAGQSCVGPAMASLTVTAPPTLTPTPAPIIILPNATPTPALIFRPLPGLILPTATPTKVVR